MSARRFRRISYIALLAVLGVHLAPVTGEAQQHAMPQGPSVVSGGVTVGAPSGGGLTVTQSTPRAIVNWSSFSVGQPNSITFQQPGSSSAILNRVTGGTTSTIAGKVSANGQVFLVNPNGIAITPTGTINVGGGFVGSTLDIRDQDFLGGVLDFFGTGSSAGVVNQGSIQAGSGGFVGLLGGNISNAGTISVPLGRVGLGAGERAALDLTGDGFLQVAIPPGTVSARALIDSSGRIKAPGGRVELKAATVRRAIRDAVNVSGTIAAKSVSGVDGAIVLGGGEGGNVNVTGTLDAGGATKGGAVDVSGRSVRIDGDARISTRSEAAKGGAVTITASDKITLGKAKIDASGATGGGHVRIGGDLQGGGTLTRAHDVVIGADAEIRADAAADGNGGTIIVWSDSLTSFEGRISARGGALGGDGGFVEVSGKQVLDYRGLADLTSYKGRFGTLLLDPYDITIWSGASARVSGLTPSANDSLINVSTLRDQIELANVTLTTGASGSQSGNITLLAPLSWTADTVLTLSAAGSIFVHAPIVATGTSAGFAVNHGGQFKVSPGAFVSLPGASSTFSANGESYTMIRSVADLQAIQNGLAGKYAIAVAIDAADTATWNGGAGFKPIGKDYPFFTGSLQGLGNPIVNLTINRPGEDWVGLFSVTDGGAFISNVALTGVSITGQSKVGGLVGTSYGASTISSSYVTGSISANGWESSVGGIVGYAWNGGVIADSFSSADVTGTGVVGGLVGFNQGTITRSHATGTITATNYIAGGLVGSNYGTVQYSYATGAVHATDMMAGGLVGDNTSARIDHSYSTGAVTGGDSVGGLVGYMNRAAVLGSYATGSVAGQSSAGGLIGTSANNSHVTESYWDIQTTGQSWGTSYASGTFVATGLTTAQATSQASYTSFDFANTWVSFDGARPMLRHEYSQGIWNTNQLQLMGLNLSGRYILIQDIDASATAVASSVWATSGFSPVAVGSNNFTGSFDGDGFEISGLTINRASQTDVGLFGRASGSFTRISNVGIVGGSITGGTNTGALVGLLGSSAVVSNSYASSAVTGTSNTGGLIGAISSATVTGSHATGTVAGSQSTGGLVGSLGYSTLSGNYATGTVTGVSSTGGLVGTASGSTISGVHATANVVSTGNSAGGLLGGVSQTTVTSSYATGSAQGLESVGGLIGIVAYGSTVSKSYATGTVSGTTQVGGLVGFLRETNHSPLSSVTESYATGNVTGTGSKVGGLVGYSNYYTSVTKSYATGNVSGATNVGGLIGESWQYTTISHSYATGTVSGTTSVGGLVGLLQQASNIRNSYATGSATGSRAGGLVGSVSGSIVRESYATGDASGPESIGGLVGYLYQGSVYSSYARGNATGTGGSSNLIGGLVGVSHGSYLESNYSTGTALGTTNVGGFIGLNNGSSLSANYWDTQSSGRATGGSGVSYGVTGRTTAQMQNISNFATNFVGWDFTGVWVPPNQAGQGGDTTAHYPELYAMARAIAVKADDASVTYGDARPSFTYGRYGGYDAVTGVTAYVLAGPETITPSDIPGAFSLADPNASSKSSTGHDNAGSYAITANAVASPGISAASPAGTETYRLIVVPGTLTVDRKALTATATANNKVYDATAAGSVTFADDRLSGDVLTVDSTETVFADVNVGTGIATTTSGITLSGADAANYSVNATATSSADITVRHVTVTADAGQSKIYGTTDPVLAYAISSGSLVGSDAFSGVLSRAAGENVGSYSIGQGSLDLGGNYNLTFTPGTTFGVTQRPITVAANAGQSKVYGNADSAFTYTIGGLGLAFSDTLSGALARTAGENVGNYAIGQGTIAASSNYNLTFTPGTTFAVTQRPITVTADSGQSKIYGHADPAFAYTIGGLGLAFSDTLSGALARTAGENVGSYAIGQGSIAASSNYALTFTPGSTFAVTPRAIAVTADTGQAKVYGNADPVFAYAISSGTLVGSDAFSGTLDRATGENVGTYSIALGSLTLGPNYTLTVTPGTTFAVTPRPIAVAANAGQSKIYGNADPVLAYAISSGSLVGSDAFSGVLSRAAGENVGSFAIEQGSLDLGWNYNLTFTPGTTFAVTQRPITVTANAGQSKVYGNADPVFAYAIGGLGLAFSDTLSGALARTAGENVGSYAIGQGTIAASSNYTLTFTPGTTFAVTPRPITVTADAGQSKVYGNTDPAFAYTIGGMGMAFSDALSGALTRATGEDVGSYAIGQGTIAASSNYALTFTPGTTFAVTPRPITVTADTGQSKVYGNADPVFTYHISSGTLVGSEAFSGVLDRVSGENVGTYGIGAGSLALSANYTLSFVPGTSFAITPRPVTVAANAGQTKIYGNADPVLAYAISSGSLVGSDAFSGDLSRSAGENVGSYAIEQGSLDLGGNYNLTFTPGTTFAITPRSLTVTALNVTRVNDGVAFYGGNGVSYAGLAVWDTPSVLGGTLVYGGSAQGSHKTGSYDITVSGLSSGNYTIGYMPGMLVIDPKPPSGPSLSSMTPQTLVAGQTMQRWSSDKTSPLFPVEFNNQVAADEDSEND